MALGECDRITTVTLDYMHVIMHASFPMNPPLHVNKSEKCYIESYCMAIAEKIAIKNSVENGV